MGYFFAVASAFVWALAIVLFKSMSQSVHPILMNLCKNILAVLLLWPTFFIFDGVETLALNEGDNYIFFWSGFAGIGIADACVLRAIAMIGATRYAIVECLYSPMVILISIFYLHEVLTIEQFLGILLIISAVLFVVFKKPEDATDPKTLRWGVFLGVLGILIMATSIVLAKPAIERAPSIYAAAIRVSSGVVGAFFMLYFVPRLWQELKVLAAFDQKLRLGIASVLSAYVSMIFGVAGYKYAEASVAAALIQTSTVFTVMLAWLILREKMTRPKMVGVVLVFIGVALVATGGV